MTFSFTDLSAVFVAIVIILAIWLYKTTLLPAGFPPGPRPVPFFGNMLQIRQNNILKIPFTYDRLSKIYGPVFGLKMGSVPAVILADLEVMREALVKNAEAFSRPYTLPVAHHSFAKNGRPQSIWTLGNDPQQWTKLSKEYLLEGTDLKPSVELRIQEEVEIFCLEIKKLTNKPVSLQRLNKISISNVLYSNIFGSRLDYNDNKLSSYIQRVDQYLTEKTYGSIVNFLPVLYYMGLGKKLFQKITENLNIVDKFLDEELKAHREGFDPEVQKSLVDFYLSESTKDRSLNDDSFLRYILDIQAGTSGVFSALDWLWLLMAKYPNIQRGCQREIDDFLGGLVKFNNGTKIRISDCDDLPYVHATVLETFRFVSPAPLSIPYETVKDVTIAGYHIPKNTLVTASLFSVHRNQKYWENPDEFKPERWLTEDGMLNKSKMNESHGFIPFGVGRRQCAGKYLALGEVFIFFATVMKKFEIQLADPENPPSLEADFNLIMKTKPHELVITTR